MALVLAATVFVTLCPLSGAKGCVDQLRVTGEIWADAMFKDVTLYWRLEGKVVAQDVLPLLGPKPQRVALLFEGPHSEGQLSLEVVSGAARSRDALVLPPPCGVWLQLADFTWDQQGIQADLVNLGLGTTGYIPLRWFVNGILISELAVGPLAPGGKVQVLLPKASHPLLLQASTETKKPTSRKKWVPVVVTLTAQPGPEDWEAPAKEWSWHLGFVRLIGNPGQGTYSFPGLSFGAN